MIMKKFTAMKKTAILLTIGVFLSVSCERTEQKSQVLDVSFTPCEQGKQQSKLKSSELSSSVDVKFTGNGVQITYNDFVVTCDFTSVNVTHTLVNGVLNITQQAYPSQANCVCHTDVSYTVSGISQNEVNVIFINGVQVYCHNENTDSNEEEEDFPADIPYKECIGDRAKDNAIHLEGTGYLFFDSVPASFKSKQINIMYINYDEKQDDATFSGWYRDDAF